MIYNWILLCLYVNMKYEYVERERERERGVLCAYIVLSFVIVFDLE